MSELQAFRVSFYEVVRARTATEARAKAIRKVSRERLMVSPLAAPPPPPDPEHYCRHGILWSAYCDRC